MHKKLSNSPVPKRNAGAAPISQSRLQYLASLQSGLQKVGPNWATA